MANFQESRRPLLIPKRKIQAADKSTFLLANINLLTKRLNWSHVNQNKLLLASRYFLAAKQLADDVYDYKEDWQSGRRNFAHRGLQRLPIAEDLTKYYQHQAAKIIEVCQCCRDILKTVSALEKPDCFDRHLKTIEANCSQALANLNQKSAVNHKEAKNRPGAYLRAKKLPGHNL
jgi:hypothetical protein